VNIKKFSRILALVVVASLLPAVAHAGTLGTDIIGLFPKDVGEFAYADLKKARQFPWFAQLKEQMLPSRFRQFEQFLAAAGINPDSQVDELAWALVPASVSQTAGGVAVPTGDQIVGVALGQFAPASAEAYFQKQKLPTSKMRNYTLFAFGSGAGPNDLFFFFIDSNTAAFGHRALLEKLIDVRFGVEDGLLRDDKLFPLINETNGTGTVWAVLNPSYTRLAMQQLLPGIDQFPQAAQLAGKIHSLTISVEAASSIDARFQAVCSTPDDANTFAALLQAGLLYRRYQETQVNPDLVQLLDSARVTPRGDRLDIRFALTNEQMADLIRRNTFTFRM
jgi:hypothetical protein